MENIEGLELLVTQLNDLESREINGGDGLTEAFFGAIGYCVEKMTIYRSKMSYRNTNNIYPAGMVF